MTDKRIKIYKDSIELFGDHNPKDVIEMQRRMNDFNNIRNGPPHTPPTIPAKFKAVPRRRLKKKGGWSKDEIALLYYCKMNGMSFKNICGRLNRKFDHMKDRKLRTEKGTAEAWYRFQRKINANLMALPDTSEIE